MTELMDVLRGIAVLVKPSEDIVIGWIANSAITWVM